MDAENDENNALAEKPGFFHNARTTSSRLDHKWADGCLGLGSSNRSKHYKHFSIDGA